MGFPFRAAGYAKRAKECWNESHTINGSAPAAKTKENLAEVNLPLHLSSSGGTPAPSATVGW
jgi:hypothetical protein